MEWGYSLGAVGFEFYLLTLVFLIAAFASFLPDSKMRHSIFRQGCLQMSASCAIFLEANFESTKDNVTKEAIKENLKKELHDSAIYNIELSEL